MINVPSTLNILLRHVRSLIPFVIVLLNTRQALELIHIWSTSSHERSRVIAFVCLFHSIREHRNEMIGAVLQKIFLYYLKNCKFTSTTTLPLIDFMQRSVLELYSLDSTVTYQDGFVFLRHLAVHLHVTVQNKNHYYPTLKRHSHDDEQIVETKSFDNIEPQIKLRSIGSSSSIPSFKMQQQTTNESTIGVPS
ncbi:unnamed protein product [Rotaria sp. Silwood2]|nr:unnamed protein product [Rotaria sp. Silwood2]CAF2797498.1 unnamed protein product [Rotaria sp. Silwood2]CAF3339016.1 unnamed protein product [Rotaria sp. Silwood2]CAF4070805.1 unnamed protein product [Rotaria sp. Silwood2]CAF4145924.1 unnamed protein product [Rotaria sp. Silwood2]